MKDVTIYDGTTGEVIYEADEVRDSTWQPPADVMRLTWDENGVFTLEMDGDETTP